MILVFTGLTRVSIPPVLLNKEVKHILYVNCQVRFSEDIGITADAASRLYIYYGLASCVARLISGRLCDFQKINTFYVYQAAELVLGTSILVVTMATSYTHMIVFVVIFGFCDGLFMTTLNVLVITCVSQSQVPVAIGWELQITPIVAVGGPPAAGT